MIIEVKMMQCDNYYAILYDFDGIQLEKTQRPLWSNVVRF